MIADLELEARVRSVRAEKKNFNPSHFPAKQVIKTRHYFADIHYTKGLVSCGQSISI